MYQELIARFPDSPVLRLRKLPLQGMGLSLVRKLKIVHALYKQKNKPIGGTILKASYIAVKLWEQFRSGTRHHQLLFTPVPNPHQSRKQQEDNSLIAPRSARLTQERERLEVN